MKTIHSTSEQTTRQLGEQIGRAAFPGLRIALTGDLGAGKTTFVQGLAKGAGVPESYYITSPTFTIINEYPAGTQTLCHLDLYRLGSVDELDHIGFEECVDHQHLLVVEWPQMLKDNAFAFDLEMDFTFDAAYHRIITLIPSGQPGTNLVSSLSLSF